VGARGSSRLGWGGAQVGGSSVAVECEVAGLDAPGSVGG
jgi:hypothetical protein